MGTDENENGGVSRRDLLKKGAVAGGIIWSAPLILSDVAGALPSATGSPITCTNYYSIKIDAGPLNSGDLENCESPPAAVACRTDHTYDNGCGAIVGDVTYAPNGDPVLFLAEEFDGEQILTVVAYTKAGNDCVPATATKVDGGWRIQFPQQSLSHIQIFFCT